MTRSRSLAPGIALAFVVGELDDGAALIDRALVLNPNLAAAWIFSGWVKVWLGEPEVAIEREARAMRLSPHDPLIFNMQAATAAAHFFAGRYAEALVMGGDCYPIAARLYPLDICGGGRRCAFREPRGSGKSHGTLASDSTPRLRISNLKDLFPIRRAEDFDRWTEGMRKAGLPE